MNRTAVDTKLDVQDMSLSLEISKAKRLHGLYEESMTQDKTISTLLSGYWEAICRTSRLMSEMGVVRTCTKCALEGAGSCCFQGIEAGYDEILLFINLLLGRELPDDREVPGSCFFVGEKGCKLTARYYFCAQYLCTELQRNMGEAACASLLAAVGDEVFAGWNLEQAIRRWLAGRIT